MKGITPVVAIILLLLITISMVGFAFVWFTRVGELTTQQTQQQLQSELDRQAQKVRIDSVTTSAITVRNTGSKAIPLVQISLFAAGAVKTCTAWSPTGDLQPQATTTCTAGFSCSPNQDVRATAPGNSDAVKCP